MLSTQTLLSFPLLVLLLKVLYASLKLPVILPETKHMSQDHILEGLQLLLVLDLINRLLKLFRRQIGHVVNTGALFVRNQAESVPEILVLDHELKVRLHRVLVLLRHTQQIFTQLHVADQDFFDDADARDETILRVVRLHLASCTV